MSTSRINLSTTAYVQVNDGFGDITLEAINGDIHVVVTANQPSPTNRAYHILTDRQRLQIKPDSNVWAIAQSNGVQAVITQNTEDALQHDAWAVPKVSLPKSVFHGLWTFDISPTMWFMFENDTQVYTSTNIVSTGGVALLTTDATNTSVKMESRECPRYQPNRGHLFSTALWCPDKNADCIREWGLGFTGENGVKFRLKSDGMLYAVLESGGVETYESLIDTSSITGFDVEKNNIYDIQFQWRSAGNYKFYIGDPLTGKSRLVHTINNLGTLTAASMENPALPIHYQNDRITEDAPLYVGCADITSENGSVDTEQYGSAYAEAVGVNGTDSPVIVLRQPLLIGTENNSRTITLARISFNCTKKSTFKVWTTRDSTAITGATYKPVNSGSFVETDSTDMDATAVRATSVNTANMRFITAVPVEAAVTTYLDNPYRGRIEFPVVRGDYLVVTCTASTADATAVVEYGEQI